MFDRSAMKDEEKCQLSGLKPAAKHKITVTAVYADNNQRSSSLEFEHEGIYIKMNEYTYISTLFMQIEASQKG